MAYVCPRKSISSAQVETIRSSLTFLPKPENDRFTTVATPVNFWQLEERDGESFIRLPFLFAAALFGICPNLSLTYPLCEITFTGELRQDQVPIVGQAWRHLQERGVTTLGLPPGKGKTVMGAYLATRPGINGLRAVLVHRAVLLPQWGSTIKNNTDAVTWTVGEEDPPANFSFILCLGNRWKDIPVTVRKSVSFLLIDEAHCFCTPGFASALLAFEPQYIVVETATLERNDGMHAMIQNIVGTDGVFLQASLSFVVYQVLTGVIPVRSWDVRGTLEWSKLVSSTIFRPSRDLLILQLVKYHANKTILILTGLKNHAESLHSQLLAAGITSDCLCGKKNSYAEANVLVGTISKIGTGFDQASACATFSGNRFNMLILASSIKKTSLLTQNVGRVFRCDDPLVFHLVDADSVYLKHWTKAKSWYRERGGTIRELKIAGLDDGKLVDQQEQEIRAQLEAKLEGAD